MSDVRVNISGAQLCVLCAEVGPMFQLWCWHTHVDVRSRCRFVGTVRFAARRRYSRSGLCSLARLISTTSVQLKIINPRGGVKTITKTAN